MLYKDNTIFFYNKNIAADTVDLFYKKIIITLKHSENLSDIRLRLCVYKYLLIWLILKCRLSIVFHSQINEQIIKVLY